MLLLPLTTTLPPFPHYRASQFSLYREILHLMKTIFDQNLISHTPNKKSLPLGGAAAEVRILQIQPVCKGADFFLLQYWLTHGLNMTKRKQRFLLNIFGFTSKKFNQDNHNGGEEADLTAAANVHAGPSSD